MEVPVFGVVGIAEYCNCGFSFCCDFVSIDFYRIDANEAVCA